MLGTRAGGYVLNVDPSQLDLARFERCLGDGRRLLGAGGAAGAATVLREGLALWRGAPLVGENPLHERPRGQLMRALYRAGRQTEALDVYRQFSELLRDELGLEPSTPLKELERSILQHDAALDADPTAAVRAPDAGSGQSPRNTLPGGDLPAQISSFVGRERELTELHELLSDHRVLTLTGTGTGGVGKTRLALRLASELVGESPDGVWFVDLAALTDPTLVPDRIAGTLGVREEPGRSLAESLIAALRDRGPLVILDNCEHLIDACATLAAAITGACPKVSLLATSREPLAIPGECTYRVPSLSVPAGGVNAAELAAYDAVQLFRERAVLHRPEFALDPSNAAAVASLCRTQPGRPNAEGEQHVPQRFQPYVVISDRDLSKSDRHALTDTQTLRPIKLYRIGHLAQSDTALLNRQALSLSAPTRELVTHGSSSHDTNW